MVPEADEERALLLATEIDQALVKGPPVHTGIYAWRPGDSVVVRAKANLV